MSERYPFVLQLVEENRIPQFDNLYLDMNGIIHNCSHPNDGNAHFRITEEEIILGIFSYVEHLFSLVKPQKLFFLAVDGVAPRAKMNQQRSRRFRTAKEAKELIDKAIKNGEKLPTGEVFDSNCITPGSPFMARLSEQIKYFLNKKVSDDASWRDVHVIFSGHDVPGEGEHKIMEYIRLSKAQPDYDANIRHCLYGLDADLIMLGLLSHDPHFCLLREEVTFGSHKKSNTKGLGSQQFYLLHISLVREYLDLEFKTLKNDARVNYDLERIIDDFILLCIFVGNDFVPHLPGLHINEGALGILFGIYKKILPEAGGYLNESGTLNTRRLQLILNELVQLEHDSFKHEFADSQWFDSKQLTKVQRADEKINSNKRSVLSSQQASLLNKVERFVKCYAHLIDRDEARLSFPASYPAKDRKFLRELASELTLIISFDEFDDDGVPLITLRFDLESKDQIDCWKNPVEDMMDDLEIDEPGENVNTQNRYLEQAQKVFERYKSMSIEDEFDEEKFDKAEAVKLDSAVRQWKKNYYSEKVEIDFDEPEELDRLTYSYVEGLQWVLHYYYDGVASWSWFYPYHYSPKISDLNHVDTYEFNFELGEPFKPFEQLMGVLPELSSAHIPPAFRPLMTDPDSPIIDMFPSEFETDLNGKKQAWEAIVKIPFIDQDRLLNAMKRNYHKLNEEEKKRNEFGPSWSFRHDSSCSISYPSSLPGFFPDLHNCHSLMTKYDLPTLGGLRLIKGLCEGVLLGKDTIAGFPSLYNLSHVGNLDFHGVKIHQSESKGETVVVSLENPYQGIKTEDLAMSLVGNQVYVNYPFLQEARVIALSDDLFRYTIDPLTKRTQGVPHNRTISWKRTAESLEYEYSKKAGTVIGPVEVIVHTRKLKCLKRMDDGALVKVFEDVESDYALQTVVTHVSSEDPRFMEKGALTVEEEFPKDSKVFFLGILQYGAPAQVIGHSNGKIALKITYFSNDKKESWAFKSQLAKMVGESYFPSFVVSKRLGMKSLTLSKITSSVMITLPNSDEKLNIGLNLKFEAKSQKVLGYSRKSENGWEYSETAVNLIAEYKSLFPEVIQKLDYSLGHDVTSAEDFFTVDLNERISAIKTWVKKKGVRDFEKVSLFADVLDSKAIAQIELISEKFLVGRKTETMKQAIIKNVPRNAILKPAHAIERLREQNFVLGDRVTMASDSGTVPISARGTVVGITDKMVEVVFDGPFIGGTSLNNRCTMYRGAIVSPSVILNISSPQYIQSIGRGPGDARDEKGVQGSTTGGIGLQFTKGRAIQPALQLRNNNESLNYKAATTRSVPFESKNNSRGGYQVRVLTGSSSRTPHSRQHGSETKKLESNNHEDRTNDLKAILQPNQQGTSSVRGAWNNRQRGWRAGHTGNGHLTYQQQALADYDSYNNNRKNDNNGDNYFHNQQSSSYNDRGSFGMTVRGRGASGGNSNKSTIQPTGRDPQSDPGEEAISPEKLILRNQNQKSRGDQNNQIRIHNRKDDDQNLNIKAEERWGGDDVSRGYQHENFRGRVRGRGRGRGVKSNDQGW
ncbi:XRN 5'-3' exonuclease N-terminus-domain-containing protein [Phakopsora pachyrhizi]|uniref:5'-3' exoribonuclease 1 n=1 Tax=Phakopsora pachyrhizi TaxID=170000 RepID=A0AAV0BEJ2_PHAPC|nr:XRN 5'-3' exonuclease N-terminus-domain-containing protein [Phakopsora pachyrhizi]